MLPHFLYGLLLIFSLHFFFQPSLFTPFPQFFPSTLYTGPSVLFQSPALFCPSISLGAHIKAPLGLYIKPPLYLMLSPYSSTLSIDSQTPFYRKISVVSHSTLASPQVSASTFCPPVSHISFASIPFQPALFKASSSPPDSHYFSASHRKKCAKIMD